MREVNFKGQFCRVFYFTDKDGVYLHGSSFCSLDKTRSSQSFGFCLIKVSNFPFSLQFQVKNKTTSQPSSNRCVLLSVRRPRRCFLQKKPKQSSPKTQAPEVQTGSLPACESFILHSRSPCWLTALHLYTAQSHNVFPAKAWWEISSRRCGWIKLNHSLWLPLLPFLSFLYYLWHKFPHLWPSEKHQLKRQRSGKKKKKSSCLSGIETGVCVPPLAARRWPWGSWAGVSWHQLLWMCSVCKCSPGCLVGAALIRSEVRVDQRAWPPDEV